MALKPTIYKFRIDLADTDRDHYQDLQLTVARHPSETAERMLARVLAYCLNWDEALAFASGLSDSDEPDLWNRSADGKILEWIQVGEPSAERIRKAARGSERVLVYSFNHKSDQWWSQIGTSLEGLAVEVCQFPWPSMQSLAALVTRNTRLSITIARPSVFVAADAGEVDVRCSSLDRGSG